MPLFIFVVVVLFSVATTGTEGAFEPIDPSSKVYWFSNNQMLIDKAGHACEANNMVKNFTETQQNEVLELCKNQAATNLEGAFSKGSFWWPGANGIQGNSLGQCKLLETGVHGCTTTLPVPCNQGNFQVICVRKITPGGNGPGPGEKAKKSTGHTAWELSKLTVYVNVFLCVVNLISTL